MVNLEEMQGKTHKLYSSVVILEKRQAKWSFTGEAQLTMASLKNEFLKKYIKRNWNTIKNCCGGYEIEKEGLTLFKKISGDYFSILGIPVLQVTDYLRDRGLVVK